jgi:hypothetical protein
MKYCEYMCPGFAWSECMNYILECNVKFTGDNKMVVTELTTIPTWRVYKQVRSIFLIFSVQTFVYEQLLSCALDKNIFNDPLQSLQDCSVT